MLSFYNKYEFSTNRNHMTVILFVEQIPTTGKTLNWHFGLVK